MYLIRFFEGKDKKSCKLVRITVPTSFNIELKEKFINIFDEESKAYNTEHFDTIDVITEKKVICIYRFIEE